jgi:hypothetical protein
MRDFPRTQKSIRWTHHALEEIEKRELDFAEASHAAQSPEEIVLADEGRFAYLRR